ncbi:hypothetical protein EVAR_57323_1 [Eumeta japonica]|uniref:Uncharacterized protein n=1 Tax=Eumeta variegata TaxID=151549 RepID=A0A4C1ZVD2_EUMVA|nr:hypothetical protein EVAR_57323_1 [Eumeta japonica]
MNGQQRMPRRRAGNGFAPPRTGRAYGMVSTGSSGTLGETGRMFYLSTTRADVQPERVCRPPGEYLFPDDRVDTDGPYHTELRRRTDGSIRPPEASDILSEMDPPSLGLK